LEFNRKYVVIPLALGVFSSTAFVTSGKQELNRSNKTLSYSKPRPPSKNQISDVCFGQTNKPHGSGHFPGTVSVSSTTVCPGSKVYVTTVLRKKSWFFINLKITKATRSGFGKVTLNVADNCNDPRAKIYEAYSVHWTADGKSARTYNSELVTC